MPEIAHTLTSKTPPTAQARPDATGGLTGQVVLSLVHGGLMLMGLIALFLAADPVFVKLHQHGLPLPEDAWAIGPKLQFVFYLLAFAVVLPLSIATGRWQTRALAGRGVDAAPVVLGNVVWLLLLLVAAKIVLAQAPPVTFGHIERTHWVRPLSWGLVLGVVVAIVANAWITQRPRVLSRWPLSGDRTSALSLGAVGLCAIVFLPGGAFDLSVGLAAFAAAVVVYAAWRLARSIRVSGAVAITLEVMVVVVALLLSWNLFLQPVYGHAARYWSIYLGPVNDVLHGRTLLVDTFALYGPGLTYFLAGLFKLFPIGYGPFAIIGAVGDVLLVAIIYAIFRVAGAPRLIAGGGILLTVSVAILSRSGPTTSLVNRPLRLVPVFLAILLVLLAERTPSRQVPLTWALAALMGVSSIWAVETFLYALAAPLGAVAARARLDAKQGLRVDWRYLGRIAVGVVVAQLVFALGTHTASGAWPNWILYFDHVLQFTGGLGSRQLNPLKPGLLVGAFYFGSCVVIVTILIWSRSFAERHRCLVVALATVTAVAVAHFSYMAGEGELGSLILTAPLACTLLVLWIALVDEADSAVSRRLSVGFVLMALFFMFSAVLAQHTFFGHLRRTALLGGPSVVIDDVRYAASSPPLGPTSLAAAAFVRRTMPQERPLILLNETLTTEINLRTGKINLLPIPDPRQERLLPSRPLALRRLASRLPLHTRFVSDSYSYFLAGGPQLSDSEIDLQVLHELRADYVIHVVEKGPDGFAVYELVARR